MSDGLLYAITREFDCTPDRMWLAWTTASELEQWYHPTVLSVVPGSVTSEPVVGGRWAVAVDVPMNDIVAYFWGRYLVVDLHKRIEHTLSYSQDITEFDARDDEAPAHRMVIEFDAVDSGTRVRFSQFGEMSNEQVDATRMGMESYFDSLDEHLRQ